MEDNKILPCPFCNSDVDDFGIEPEYGYGEPKLYWLVCSCCEATGPRCRTKELAIGEWNLHDERKR